jgi:hypothetical protein
MYDVGDTRLAAQGALHACAALGTRPPRSVRADGERPTRRGRARPRGSSRSARAGRGGPRSPVAEGEITSHDFVVVASRGAGRYWTFGASSAMRRWGSCPAGRIGNNWTGAAARVPDHRALRIAAAPSMWRSTRRRAVAASEERGGGGVRGGTSDWGLRAPVFLRCARPPPSDVRAGQSEVVAARGPGARAGVDCRRAGRPGGYRCAGAVPQDSREAASVLEQLAPEAAARLAVARSP